MKEFLVVIFDEIIVCLLLIVKVWCCVIDVVSNVHNTHD